MADVFRQGESEIREAVRSVLSERRGKDDVGLNFRFDCPGVVVATDKAVEDFMINMAAVMRARMAAGALIKIAGFGTFAPRNQRASVGSGALAGRVLSKRRSVGFVPSSTGWPELG